MKKKISRILGFTLKSKSERSIRHDRNDLVTDISPNRVKESQRVHRLHSLALTPSSLSFSPPRIPLAPINLPRLLPLIVLSQGQHATIISGLAVQKVHIRGVYEWNGEKTVLVNTSVILQRIDRRSTSLRISLFFFFFLSLPLWLRN